MILISGLEPLEAAFWRTFLAAAVLAPAAAWQFKTVDLRSLALIQVGGFALSMHFISWIYSLHLTSVAASTTIVSTYPIFTIFISRLLGEPVGPLSIAGSLTAVAGVSIMTLPRWGGEDFVGNMLALAAAVFGAIYFSVGRVVRARVGAWAYAMLVYLSSSAFTTAVSLALGEQVLHLEPRELAYAAAIAIVPTVFGHGLLNYALRYFKAVTVSSATLGEPVGSSILAYVILGQAPDAWTVAGMSVVLPGIFTVLLGEARGKR